MKKGAVGTTWVRKTAPAQRESRASRCGRLGNPSVTYTLAMEPTSKRPRLEESLQREKMGELVVSVKHDNGAIGGCTTTSVTYDGTNKAFRVFYEGPRVIDEEKAAERTKNTAIVALGPPDPQIWGIPTGHHALVIIAPLYPRRKGGPRPTERLPSRREPPHSGRRRGHRAHRPPAAM